MYWMVPLLHSFKKDVCGSHTCTFRIPTVPPLSSHKGFKFCTFVPSSDGRGTSKKLEHHLQKKKLRRFTICPFMKVATNLHTSTISSKNIRNCFIVL